MAVTNRLIVGEPKPGVTWWREGRLIDSSWEEGLQAIFMCRAITNRLIVGDPKPGVTWWREGRLIDSSWEEGFSGEIHNTVQIGPLTR